MRNEINKARLEWPFAAFKREAHNGGPMLNVMMVFGKEGIFCGAHSIHDPSTRHRGAVQMRVLVRGQLGKRRVGVSIGGGQQRVWVKGQQTSLAIWGQRLACRDQRLSGASGE